LIPSIALLAILLLLLVLLLNAQTQFVFIHFEFSCLIIFFQYSSPAHTFIPMEVKMPLASKDTNFRLSLRGGEYDFKIICVNSSFFVLNE